MRQITTLYIPGEEYESCQERGERDPVALDYLDIP